MEKTINNAKLKAFFEQNPVLSTGEPVFLSKIILRNLDDDAFTELWNIPDLEITVSEAGGRYIEKRRRGLGLIKKRPEENI